MTRPTFVGRIALPRDQDTTKSAEGGNRTRTER